MEVLAPVRDASLPIPQRPNPQRPNPQRWVGLEAWGVLHPRVKDFAGAKLADPLLELVFAHSPLAGGFPCRRDAVVALGRRFRACKREGLGVVERPEGGEVFGIYATGHPDEGARPYRTHLRSVSPLEGSCDCRDFRCNSLGVCKHLLAVLRDLVGRPRLWQRAISQGAAPLDLHARLTWSPARPWDGAGDWLERVILVAGHGPLSPDEHDLIEAWLRPVGNPADLRWTPRAVFADEPARRLELTRLLLDHATWPSCYAGERHLPDPALVALLSADFPDAEVVRFATEGQLGGALGVVSDSAAEEVIFISSATDDTVSFLTAAAADPTLDDKRFFLTDAAANEDLLVGLPEGDTDLYARIRGTRPATDPDLADDFARRYRIAFGESDVDALSFTTHAYDAGWLALYGASWALLQEGGVSPRGVARGLRQVSGGAELDVGELSWTQVVDAFAAGESVDVSGASGALDYDPATEERAEGGSSFAVWVISRDGARICAADDAACVM